MNQCIKTSEAVASYCGAIFSSAKPMEAENHGLLNVAEVKNGAIPKSLMSRGNFFTMYKFEM